MKVNNNKIGAPLGNLDAGKTGKADNAAALKKDAGLAGLLSSNSSKNTKNVNVSERAQMMQKAKDIASSPLTVDEAKVARLQKMIDDGNYKVDAESVADRLVDEHLTWD